MLTPQVSQCLFIEILRTCLCTYYLLEFVCNCIRRVDFANTCFHYLQIDTSTVLAFINLSDTSYQVLLASS